MYLVVLSRCINLRFRLLIPDNHTCRLSIKLFNLWFDFIEQFELLNLGSHLCICTHEHGSSLKCSSKFEVEKCILHVKLPGCDVLCTSNQ